MSVQPVESSLRISPLLVVFKRPDGALAEHRLPAPPCEGDEVVLDGERFVASRATWRFDKGAFGRDVVSVHVELQALVPEGIG